MKPNMKRESDEVFFESLITGDPSQAIMNQEARGQQDLAFTDVLPIDTQDDPRVLYESLGFVFGELVDDLFIEAKLPDGWKKVPTSHSMHTDLVDEHGRRRGGIFYKAAFYDRSAHMYLSQRFSYGHAPVGGWGQEDYRSKPFESYVRDLETIIWHSDPYPNDWDAQKRYDQQAQQWLEEHYPHWKSVLAYWDVPAPSDPSRGAESQDTR